MVLYNGATYRYVYSLQGDILGLQNGTGAFVVEYRYDAWGRQTSKTGSLAASLGALNPFRYRGYVYDEETGLYYLRSRYYNPNWCRFISTDSILGQVGGLLQHNLFAYCCNTPVIHVDMDGKIMGTVEGENGGLGGPTSYARYDVLPWEGAYVPEQPCWRGNERKIVLSILAIPKCLELQGGIGIGLGTSKNGLGAYAHWDIFAFKLNADRLEVGMGGAYGVGYETRMGLSGNISDSIWQPAFRFSFPQTAELYIEAERDMGLEVGHEIVSGNFRSYKIVGYNFSYTFNAALYDEYLLSIWR